MPEHEKSLRKIVEVLFLMGEPRTSFPNQEHRGAGDPFSPHELKAAARRLSPRKSPELAGIRNEVVRLITKKNPQMLTSVFNKCLEEGIFPDRWKRQKLVLIPNSTQASVADPSSFRPLGMIDSMGKLFERLILNRMKNVCKEEDNEGISAAQFSFRKGMSTHHALKKVEERVSEALHVLLSPEGFCAIIALDAMNAFNSASWECIYQSLAKEKKMPQYLLRIIDLKDRKLTIVTEEGTVAADLSAGVPRRSIKGPFLWTCMYDGLLRMKLPDGASLFGFADDLALLVVAEKAWLVEIIANEALELIAEWLISRSLQLTVCKCKAILVTRRRKYEAPRFEIKGGAIPLKQEIKYLGVWLDSKWSFKHHVKQAATKASITCTSLMRLMPNIGGLCHYMIINYHYLMIMIMDHDFIINYNYYMIN